MTTYVGSGHGFFPYSAVTFIEATFPNGETYTGSGAVVGPNDVLTSAHVIYSAANGGLADEIVVYPGRDGFDTPYGSFNAGFVNYFPVDQDGDGLLGVGESEDDIAILGFDTRIADQTGQFEIDPYGLAGYYNLTGFPGVYADATGPRMTNDYGRATLNNSYDVFDLDGPFGFEVNSGNSGGPLWHYDDGVASVSGVLSTGVWATDLYGHADVVADWISGNDSLIGGGSGGLLEGGASADVLDGSNASDTVYGHDGNDTINGFDADDQIYGNRGLDLLDGGNGDDMLFGGQNGGQPTLDARGSLKMQAGTETVIGGQGDDLIYGNFGSDVLEGGSDSDTLFGGQGDDLILGGAGADTLFGNRGDDTLNGGSGPDAFYIQNDSGNDVIQDMTFFPIETSDTIHIQSGLNGTGIDDFSDLQDRMAPTAQGGTLIDLDDSGFEHSLLIEGKTQGSFIASDFAFF